MDGFLTILSDVLVPTTPDNIKVFYAIVMVTCLAINIAWDCISRLTPAFSLARISEKVSLLFSSSTIASSLLLIIAVFDKDVSKALGDFWLPFLLAGGAGLLISLQDLSPHRAYQSAVQSTGRNDGS